MAKVHTVAVRNEFRCGTVSSTKRSENRTYAACVVGTATAEVVARIEAENARRAALPENNFLRLWILRVPEVGAQSVFSWHESVEGARKSLSGWAKSKGCSGTSLWSLEVRTDIAVREASKRAA